MGQKYLFQCYYPIIKLKVCSTDFQGLLIQAMLPLDSSLYNLGQSKWKFCEPPLPPFPKWRVLPFARIHYSLGGGGGGRMGVNFAFYSV